MSNINDENEEYNFEEYEEEGGYEGDEEEYVSDEDYSAEDEYYDEDETYSEDYDGEGEYVSGDDDYSGEEIISDGEEQGDDFVFEDEPIEESPQSAGDGEQIQSPYLNGGAAPQKAKKNSSMLGVLLVIFFLLAGLIGTTYIKTGTFDVTALFSGDNTNVAKGDTSKPIEDVAIQNEGDDFFAQATGLGAKDGEEKAEEEKDKAQEPDEQPQEEAKAASAEPAKTVKVEVPKAVADNLPDAAGGRKLVVVRQGGRKDPFLPLGYRSRADEFLRAKSLRPVADDDLFYDVPPSKDSNGDYIKPPTRSSYEKEYVDNLMKITKFTVNGIMFDSQQPSAILRYNNVDYLVHKGDTFDMFKVENITKNSVVIKSGTNTYTAVLGQTRATDSYDAVEVVKGNNLKELNRYVEPELLPADYNSSYPGVHVNPVSNLDKKFGGNYGGYGSFYAN